MDRAGIHIEAEILDRDDAAEDPAEIADLENWLLGRRHPVFNIILTQQQRFWHRHETVDAIFYVWRPTHKVARYAHSTTRQKAGDFRGEDIWRVMRDPMR
jgi:hypothetical protein